MCTLLTFRKERAPCQPCVLALPFSERRLCPSALSFQALHVPRHPCDIHHPIRVTLAQLLHHLRSFDAPLLNIFYRINKISDPLNKLLNQICAQIVRKLQTPQLLNVQYQP